MGMHGSVADAFVKPTPAVFFLRKKKKKKKKTPSQASTSQRQWPNSCPDERFLLGVERSFRVNLSARPACQHKGNFVVKRLLDGFGRGARRLSRFPSKDLEEDESPAAQ